MASKKEILNALREIVDPEIGINIVDLGLIYGIKINNGNVYIKMTLTTKGCPLMQILPSQVKEKIRNLKGVKNVKVELSFEPRWTPKRINKNG